MSKKELPVLDAVSVQLEDEKLDRDVVAQVAVSDPAHWKQNRWNEQPHWECLHCPFDTLDGEAIMVAHFRAHHAPASAPAPMPIVPSVDRFGNVL